MIPKRIIFSSAPPSTKKFDGKDLNLKTNLQKNSWRHQHLRPNDRRPYCIMHGHVRTYPSMRMQINVDMMLQDVQRLPASCRSGKY